MTDRIRIAPSILSADFTRLAEAIELIEDGGADFTRDAPLDTLPLYQRAGSIVPLLSPDVQTLATTSDPSVVDMLDRADVLDHVNSLPRHRADKQAPPDLHYKVPHRKQHRAGGAW